MIRPELLHLNFDACERLTVILDALEAAGLGPEDRVLDVGGHPGLLAGVLEGRCRVVTADFPPTGHLPYLRASGDALPFADSSFTAVVASDTLEHVPPAAREPFLAEMWRVARRLVLVGGPYATAGVARAEARLLELEGMIRAVPDRWLAEHAEHGLPRLTDTWNAFAGRGARVSARPNGDLLRWFLLFAGRTVLEELPEATEALDRFMPDYNRLLAPLPAGPSAPTYRHLVMAWKEPDGAAGNGDGQGHGQQAPGALLTRPEQIPAEGTPEDAAACQRIDALAGLFQSLAAALQAQARRAEEGGGLERAWLERTEQALVQQNQRLRQLERQLASGTPAGGAPEDGRRSLLRRVLDRLRRRATTGTGPDTGTGPR